MPRAAGVASAAASDAGACSGCNAEQTKRFDELEKTVLPAPVNGGVHVLLLPGGQKLWAECGVHPDDILVRVAGRPVATRAAGSPAALAKACALRERFVTITAAARRAALCQRKPARPATWVKKCEQFFSEFRALAEPNGALLSGIEKDSAPWRCGLRSGSVVTELGNVKKPTPDELGSLFDSCQGAPVRRVVVAPKPAPPPMSPAALRRLLATIKVHRTSPHEFKLDSATRNRIMAHLTELLLSARMAPEMKNGKAVGVRLFSVQPNSLLGALGFKSGDLVQSVNGMSLTSPAQSLQAYADLRRARDVTVHLERAGKPVDIEFHVR